MSDGWSDLETRVDVEDLSFDQIMRALRTFVRTLLLDDEPPRRLELGIDVRTRSTDLLDEIGRWDDATVPEVRAAARVKGWTLHDGSVGRDRDFAAVLVLCTYDRVSAEFDVFGPEPMMESVMASIGALGTGAEGDFVNYLHSVVTSDRA